MATAVIITAATASIMSTDRPAAGRWTAIFFAAIGLFTISLAVPRVLAYGVIARDAGQAPTALANGSRLSSEAIEQARRAYRNALAVHRSDGQIARDLARFDLLALKDGDGAALLDASSHLRSAAALMPNNAFVWSLLARTAQRRQVPVDEIIAFLRLSKLTGRFEASSMLLRVHVAMLIWKDVPPDLQRDIRQDVGRLTPKGQLLHLLFRVYLALPYDARATFLDVIFDTPARRRLFLRRIVEWAKLQ